MFFVPYVQCLVLFLHFPINSNFKFSQKATPELLQKLKLRKLPTFYTFRRRKKVLQKRKKIIYKMLEIFLNFSVDFKFSTSPEINTSPYCRQKFLFLKKSVNLIVLKWKFIMHLFISVKKKKYIFTFLWLFREFELLSVFLFEHRDLKGVERFVFEAGWISSSLVSWWRAWELSWKTSYRVSLLEP